MGRVRRGAAILVGGCVVLASVGGCASSGRAGAPRASVATESTVSSGSVPPSGSSSASANVPSAGDVHVGFAASGRTIRLTPGQRLQVTLDSTYWQFTLVAEGVLRVTAGPRARPAASCIPGGGCGVVTAVFLAVAPGRAEVTAHRTVCGEAMGCTARTGMFVVHVVVG